MTNFMETRYSLFKRRIRPMLKEFGLTLYVIRKSPLAVAGGTVVFIFLFIAIFGKYIAPYDPVEANIAERFQPPSWEHLCGTDKLGRDVFSRLLCGARYSMKVGIVVLAISTPIGVLLGGVAGLLGGWFDELIMRITDVFLAFPYLLLAMAVSAALGPSLENAMLAISIVWWPPYTRLIRGQALSVRESAYIDAAKSMGEGRLSIIWRHLLPNCLSPVLITLTLDMGAVVLATAALSFLGFGAQPPLPEWGRMISDGRIYLFQAWWISTFSGLAIALTVLGFNLLGDGIRDALDPKLRRVIEVEHK
jgi:peptide/nickel transport system permease protein